MNLSQSKYLKCFPISINTGRKSKKLLVLTIRGEIDGEKIRNATFK